MHYSQENDHTKTSLFSFLLLRRIIAKVPKYGIFAPQHTSKCTTTIILLRKYFFVCRDFCTFAAKLTHTTNNDKETSNNYSTFLLMLLYVAGTKSYAAQLFCNRLSWRHPELVHTEDGRQPSALCQQPGTAGVRQSLVACFSTTQLQYRPLYPLRRGESACLGRR